MYADEDYYRNVYMGTAFDETETINRYLKKAGRHIDSLTFNRIRGIGFGNLTDFQKEIVQEVECKLAEFEHENSEFIENVISGYSLNGVSVSFEKTWNITIVKGVAIPTELFDTLSQTGLCMLQI